jgi:uncharacterized OsmC-like protein
MTTQLTPHLNDVNLPAVGNLAGAVQDDPTRAATVWQASVQWRGGFRSEARIRGFDPFPSDEPVGLGGTDTAPNPVEQLLGAFGNCLAVGYAANASGAGIEINDLRIDLEGDLDLHTFLGLRPGHAGYERLKVTVHLDADATNEQLDELHEKVVSTSPVGHTLGAAIPLRIELA